MAENSLISRRHGRNAISVAESENIVRRNMAALQRQCGGGAKKISAVTRKRGRMARRAKEALADGGGENLRSCLQPAWLGIEAAAAKRDGCLLLLKAKLAAAET